VISVNNTRKGLIPVKKRKYRFYTAYCEEIVVVKEKDFGKLEEIFRDWVEDNSGAGFCLIENDDKNV
jgi:hypothetical protein